MATRGTKPSGEIAIQAMVRGEVDVKILGTTPLICNRLSEKASHELLMPKAKGSTRGSGLLKHDPYLEFQASPYLLPDVDEYGFPAPTYIALLASAFKGAMMTAALDMPDAKKAQVGRLVHVITHAKNLVPVYGVPQLMMAITRSADINRTPDVRTRAILPKWAAKITVSYTQPLLKAASVLALLQSGGITAGVGDWRAEKGKGNYGSFVVVSPDDADLNAEWDDVAATGDRIAQVHAMKFPTAYDDETEGLLKWFTLQATQRGFQVSTTGVVPQGSTATFAASGAPVPSGQAGQDQEQDEDEEFGEAGVSFAGFFDEDNANS